jgi:hypothetical protein
MRLSTVLLASDQRQKQLTGWRIYDIRLMQRNSHDNWIMFLLSTDSSIQITRIIHLSRKQNRSL